MICVDFKEEKITIDEAWLNFKETFDEEDPHCHEVWKMLADNSDKDAEYD